MQQLMVVEEGTWELSTFYFMYFGVLLMFWDDQVNYLCD